MVNNYYARLNENQIAVEIVSTVKDYTDIKDYIKLENYNESVLFRKWLGNQWSQEKYEPGIETKILEEIENLKEENESKDTAIQDLKNEFNKTQGTDKIVLSSIFNIDTRLLAIEEKLKGSEK